MWQYLNDKNTWTNFRAEDSAAVEKGFQAGQKTVKLKDYIVDFKKEKQTRIDDSHKFRNIRRVAPATSESGAGKKRPRSADSDVTVIEPPPPVSLVRIYHVVGVLPDAKWKFVKNLISSVPDMSTMSLATAADKMRRPTRWWLGQLGRPRSDKGLELNMPAPIDLLVQTADVKLSEKFQCQVQQLVKLADAALVTSAGPLPKKLLLPYTEKDFAGTKMPAAEQTASQLLMISGPVYILYDGSYNAIPDPPVVTLCSIPGINFAYSSADIDMFTTREEADGPRVIDKVAALTRMKSIWSHVLTVLDTIQKVEYPVLCGIGCGAFKGKYGSQVPRLWASALAHELQYRKFTNISAVFISLPTFGTDNNYAPFKMVLSKAHEEKAFMTPAIVVEDASMMDIAIQLSRNKKRTGILNPSDVQALRHGWIGMYWDDGHIALEEIIGMQTTALLQHVGLNPKLYTDETRHHEVKL